MQSIASADRPQSGGGSSPAGQIGIEKVSALIHMWTAMTTSHGADNSAGTDIACAGAVVLSSDLFTAGGYGSVRGYEPAQSTGNSGASLNADLYRQFDIPDSRWYAQTGPFMDWGYVHNRVTGSTLENNIYSAGLGAEVNYRHSGKLVSKLRLDWAHPLVHKSLPEVDDNTFYARFTQLF